MSRAAAAQPGAGLSDDGVGVPAPQRVVLAQRADYLLFTLFFVGWLIPLGWVGIANRHVPFVGKYLNNQYRIAALFTVRMNAWAEFYCQVQFEGESEWRDIPEHVYSSMRVYGRPRLYFVILKSTNSPVGHLQRQEAAEHIRRCCEKRYPESPKINAVRFLQVTVKTGEHLVKQKYAWQTMPISRIPEHLRSIVGTYYVGNGLADRTSVNGTTDQLSMSLQSSEK